MKIFNIIILFTLISNISQSQQLQRYSCKIEVNGKILENAFSGGLNLPQFNQSDLNFDGLKDLIIFDRYSDKLEIFLNKGNENFIFAPKYNKYFPEISSYIYLTDYNHDGLDDIFTYYNNSLRVYKAIKNTDHIEYLPVFNPYINDYALSYRSGTHNPLIEFILTDIASIIDIDHDGDIDIISFGNYNSAWFYKNISAEKGLPPDSLKFVLVETCWGKFYESSSGNSITLSNDPNMCANAGIINLRHIGSVILNFDEDGDGDYDALVTDVGSDKIKFLKNGGDVENDYITEVIDDFPDYDFPADIKTFPGVYLVDIDNDSRQDLIASPNSILNGVNQDQSIKYPQNVKNVFLYKNIGEGNKFRFSFQTDEFLSNTMIDLGNAAYPYFIDLDKDSLIDLIVGSGVRVSHDSIFPSVLMFFKNTGDKSHPQFTLIDSDFLNLSKLSIEHQLNHFTPAFGDLDNDGDMDLLLGDHEGSLVYLENISVGSNIKFKEPILNFQNIKIKSGSRPCIFDFNNDGLQDILLSGDNHFSTILDYYGRFVYFQNQGSPNSPLFNPDPFAFPNTPKFGKITESFDVVYSSAHYSSIYTDEDDQLLFAGFTYGQILIYKNFVNQMYNKLTPLTEKYDNIDVGGFSSPTVADIDNDGYLEMLVGNSCGGLEFWKTDFKVKEGLATKEKNTEQTLNVYPIPANEFISVEFDSSQIEKCYLTLYDLLGKVILYKEIDKTNNKIDISQLKCGTYFAYLRFNNSIKLIKVIKSL